MHYDVFNGDADGIIALLQLRLSEPKLGTLISGVKRDIKLLRQVVTLNNATTVVALDISMESNMTALMQLLEQGVEVFYCDHHRTGALPQSEQLTTIIDVDAEVCTSLLINRHLNGAFVYWAVAAAYGDNLYATAAKLAKENGISESDMAFLKELGILINYNSYGASLADLHISPITLYQQLLHYSNPLHLYEDKHSPYFLLKRGFAEDHQFINQLSPIYSDRVTTVFELPSTPWARRISGVFSNELANQDPNKSHVVLTLNQNQMDYTVSIRSPLINRIGADQICSQFKTGGGRKAAAGINMLPIAEKQYLINIVSEYYQQCLTIK